MCVKHFIKHFILIFYTFSIFSAETLAQGEEISDHNFVEISNYISLTYHSPKQSLTEFTGVNTSLTKSPTRNLFEKYHYSRLNLNEETSEVNTPFESPYAVILKHNSAFTGTGFSLYGASALLRSKQSPLSQEKIEELDLNGLWQLDRGATNFSSVTAHQASNFFLYSSMATPFLYLTKERTRKNFDAIVLMQAETLLLTNAITSLTKTLVYRPRPYAYNESFPIEEKLNFNSRESFFSGHVAATASMSFFTATVFSQYYPDSKLKPLVWSYAVIWPAATGYFRYTAGKHFPTDIITGYLFGAMTGILIPKIHQKIAKKKEVKRIIWN